MKFLNFFVLLWVIFALLDPYPDPVPPTQLNPDPQPWLVESAKYSILDPRRSGSYNLQCLNANSDLVFNHTRSKNFPFLLPLSSFLYIFLPI